MTAGLDCIGVEYYLVPVCNLSYRLYGLYRADLIVGGHDRYKNCVLTQSREHCFGVDKTLRITGKICHGKAFCFKRAARVYNGIMLD